MSSSPAPAALGTGSLWNPNSWHWETRAYSAWGAASLHAALLPLRVAAGPLAVRITGITALSLDASVSIRRGRKYVVWELSKLSLSWVGYAPSGAVDRETAGTLSLGAGGVSNEDAGGEFGMRMTHTGTTAFDTSCRDIAAGGLVPLVRRTVREWAAALARHDDALEAQAIAHRDAAAITPAGVAAAAAKVAAARASAPTLLPQPQVVAEERAGSERVVEGATEGAACGTQRGASGVAALGGSGAEQGGLAAVGTAADAGAPAAPAQPSETSAGASAAPARPSEAGAAAPSTGSGGGSAWNPNAFLWEERSLTSWATDRLSQLIGGIDIDVPGGSIKIVETKLKGDASVSLRRVSAGAGGGFWWEEA